VSRNSGADVRQNGIWCGKFRVHAHNFDGERADGCSAAPDSRPLAAPQAAEPTPATLGAGKIPRPTGFFRVEPGPRHVGTSRSAECFQIPLVASIV
jgi:hypothetical protein